MNPEDHAPTSIPRRWRMFWAQVYAEALTYTAIDEFYIEDAKLTATLVTRTAMQGCRARPGLPPTGDLVSLTSGHPGGTFKRVDYVCPSGRIWHEDGRPVGSRKQIPLIWSRSARALIALPRMRPSACNLPPVKADSRVLRTFTQDRREGKCSSKIDLPRVRLPLCRPGVSISYISDKFSDSGELTEYIHHFDSPGVRVWMDRDNTPNVIFVQGGRLRIERHGIAG